MDSDQTAPTHEQSDLGQHCLYMRLKIFEWTTEIIHFVIMRFKGLEMGFQYVYC